MAYADKISLIRHYPHIKNAAHAEFEQLVTKKLIFWITEAEQARLDELEKNELKFHTFEELSEDVRQKISRCLDKDNEFLFCYEPAGTTREIDTARDLINRFQIPEEKVFEIEMPGPKGGVWMDYVSVYRRKLNSILIRASEDDALVREVVLVWRRSDSYSFLHYAHDNKPKAMEAREMLEKEAVITVDINGKLYSWATYSSALSVLMKNVSRRQFKKIIESWQLLVNGKAVSIEYCPQLAMGDHVQYKQRTAEISVSNDWDPVITKISTN